MITHDDIRFATAGDAEEIAAMSRDLIEHGLGWSWTTARVLGSIRDKSTNVVIAREPAGLAGFGIMKYHDDEAHLNLLAVSPYVRRSGVGTTLMAWLEASALTAGIGTIYLEARITNTSARDFYRKLGYHEIAMTPRYYRSREDAVRIAKDLWR